MQTSAGAPLSRQQLLEEERQRLARRRARRGSSGPALSPAAARAWASLGVPGRDGVESIRAVLGRLIGEASEFPELSSPVDVLRVCLEEVPGGGLIHALITVLSALSPESVLEHLVALKDAGAPWLTERGARKLELLAAPERLLDSQIAVRAAHLTGGSAWRLLLVAAGIEVPLSDREVRILPPCLPLSVLDNLIEAGVVNASAKPWSGHYLATDVAYLKARLAPQLLTMQECLDLDWSYQLRRCQLCAGIQPSSSSDADDVLDLISAVGSGSQSALYRLRDLLPPMQRVKIHQIIDGLAIGHWPRPVTDDRGLWAVLSVLWNPATAVDAKQSVFHTWIALRTTMGLLLAGDIDRATLQAGRMRSVEQSSGQLRPEVVNTLAYIALIRGEPQTAIQYLSRIDSAHSGADANLRLLRTRQQLTVNDREVPENPYLELGIPHGSPDWKAHWRRLRFEHRDDHGFVARINNAKDRLERAERRGDLKSAFYRIPLSPDTLQPPTIPPLSLLPPAAPLPRRTGAPTGDDLRALVPPAAPELVADLRLPRP